MNMEEILDKLTEYTLALKAGLDTTTQANERPLITGRLAAAAEMFALLHDAGSLESVRELVKSEVRAHGWSFISGKAGEKTALKWVAFTNAIGVQQ